MGIRRRTLPTMLAVGALVATGFVSQAPSALAAPPPPVPASGPCPDNPAVHCHFQYGEVHFDGQHGFAGVDDGDTADVQLYEPNTTTLSSTIVAVRFTGINAIEFTHHSSSPSKWQGECHAIAAANIVYNAVTAPADPNHVVRLSSVAVDPTTGKRKRREVDAWDANTNSWIDLGLQETMAGLALVDSNTGEYAWNRVYMTALQNAAKQQLGLFNTSSCKSGPSQAAQLRVWVKWDADGSDQKNLNGEWARIRNNSATPVGIGGWYFRDSFYRGHLAHGFVFPRGTTIPAHSEITLHVGNGTNTARKFYWKQHTAVWENEVTAKLFRGDGGYLFDPDGDMRAWMTYPCFVSCRTPLDGKIKLTAHPKGATSEWVQLKNTSTKTFNLEGYLLWQNPDSYAFSHHDSLKPGASLRLYLQKGKGGASVVRSWHLPAYQLKDGGDVVKMTDYRNHVVRCLAWGSAHC